jgi:hypothetical protein
MDSYLKKTIGQDQLDRQNLAAFGRRPTRRRPKNPVNPVHPVKKIRFESIPHPFSYLKSHKRFWN